MTRSELVVPARLTRSCAASVETVAWLERLPGVVVAAASRWRLALGDPFGDATASWVAPATLPDGVRAVLKVPMPHMEGADELAGLLHWRGEPTVRVLESDAELGAMLLERCEPGTPLRTAPEAEQDAVLAGLLRRLWGAAPPEGVFRPLAAMLEQWIAEAVEQRSGLPPVADGVRLFRELDASAEEPALLATDLHAGNVLRADREPWLVIDPKPFVGDPAFDATQHLLNGWRRLLVKPERTIHAFCELLGVDSERVRLWTFARVAAVPWGAWSEVERAALLRSLAP